MFFRAKLLVFLWHFLVSVSIIALCYWLVYNAWYPDGLASAAGGSFLLKILAISSFVSGPILTLIILKTPKSRVQFYRDFTCIVLLQLVVIGYGVHSLFLARPIFIVYSKGVIDVVTVVELDQYGGLFGSGEIYSRANLFSPSHQCISLPTTLEESNKLLFSAAQGRDVQFYPRYYRACSELEMTERLIDVKFFSELFPGGQAAVSDSKLSASVGFLPVRFRFGQGIRLFSSNGASMYIKLSESTNATGN